jgi:hypothetical protein
MLLSTDVLVVEINIAAPAKKAESNQSKNAVCLRDSPARIKR